MTIRTFAWIWLPRRSRPSQTGERRSFQDTVSNSVPDEDHRRERFQQIGVGARAQSLLIASLCIFVLLSSAPGAQAEEAIPAKDHRVKELLSSGGKYLRKNQVEQAIGQFKKAVSLNPQSAEAHMLLGYAYRVQGRYELLGEAKAELRQALALDPTLVWARFYLAKIYVDFGRLEDADAQLDTIFKSNPDIPQVLALLGEVKRQLGDPAQSIMLNQKALGLSPMLTTARYYLGLAYLDLKREGEALGELNIAASSGGANADVFLALGSIYLETNALDRAIESFKKAIELDPSRPEGRLKLARAYRLKGWLDLALAELRLTLPQAQNLRRSPYFQNVQSDIFFESGLTHEQKKNISKAIEAYLEALSLQPEKGDVHRSLASAYFQQGRYESALEHADRAGDLGSPVNPSLLLRIRAKAREVR